MSQQPQRQLPDFRPPSVSTAASINRATFTLAPSYISWLVLSQHVRVTGWRLIEGGLIKFDVESNGRFIDVAARATLFVSALAAVEKLLPVGNAIRDIRVAGDDSLEYVFEGIDAPPSLDGKLPAMVMMISTDAAGHRETWFEPSRQHGPVNLDDKLGRWLRNVLGGKGGAA